MAYPRNGDFSIKKKKVKGKILPIPPEMKKRLGSAGSLGVIGSGAGTVYKIGQRVVKGLAKKFAIKKTKMSMRKPKASICPSGIAWAKRTFDKYPSAYANMAASKYCKDPNYAKGSKKKKK